MGSYLKQLMLNAPNLLTPKVFVASSIYYTENFLAILKFSSFKVQATFEFQVSYFRHPSKQTIRRVSRESSKHTETISTKAVKC